MTTRLARYSPLALLTLLLAALLGGAACTVDPGVGGVHHVTVQAVTSPTGLIPSQLRSAYQVTALGSSTRTIAIVGAFHYPNAANDLVAYRSQFGLPPCTVGNGCLKIVNQNGLQSGYPATDVSWAQESALHLDMASAMCPTCKIALIEANDLTGASLRTSAQTASTLGQVVPFTFGTAETDSAVPSMEAILTTKSSTVAFVAPTGDDASQIEYPATSPHAISVAGSHLATDSSPRGYSEIVASDSSSGFSTLFAAPSFQVGAAMRQSPDVIAVAHTDSTLGSGVAMFGPLDATSSGWQVVQGTGVASAVYAGKVALDLTVPTLAQIYSAPATTRFDLTAGTDFDGHTAIVGTDFASGLGSPRGNTTH